MQTAKVFWQDGCQVISLPEGVCVEGTEFQIDRLGNSILITPIGGEPLGSGLRPATEPQSIIADGEPSAMILRYSGPKRRAEGPSARLGRALCGWLKFG